MTLDEHLSRSRVLRRLMAGPHKDGIELYVERLRRDGYSPLHAGSALRILTFFTQWLTDRRLHLQDVDEHLVRRFLAARARLRPLRIGDPSALRRLISTLRDAGIIGPALPVALTPHEQILEGFRQYLEQRRGLSATSAESYLWFMRRILRGLPVAGSKDLRCLTQRDVVGYVEQHAGDGSAATAKILCSRFRSFLRYIFMEGLADTDLSACIPSIRRYSLTGLPTYLSALQLGQVLRSCDRATAAGRRDYAVLMMLARLGLRAKEVATLTLDDIDWRAGQFLIKGKGRRVATRNLRLTAIRAFFRFLAFEEPASSGQIQRTLAIPGKLTEKREVHFLSRPEIDAILAAPDRTCWIGRRDHMLLLFAIQTGLRVSEIASLDRSAVTLGAGACSVRRQGPQGTLHTARKPGPRRYAELAEGARAQRSISAVPQHPRWPSQPRRDPVSARQACSDGARALPVAAPQADIAACPAAHRRDGTAPGGCRPVGDRAVARA